MAVKPKNKRRIVLSGGGTGGHIYPAISIAEQIRKELPEAEILFVGAKSKMEMQKVPLSGFKIIGLPIAGFQRGKIWANRFLGFKVLYSLSIYLWMAIRFRPQVVIGTGGYASLIPLAVSSLFPKTKTLILELNAHAGLANRLLAKRVDLICVSHLGMEKFFPAQKVRMTGVPVRSGICSKKENAEAIFEKFGLQTNRKTIFLVGGSLGAKKMNETIATCKEQIIAKGWQLIWQTGVQHHTSYRNLERAEIKIKDFIDDMQGVLSICDVVISRAGASITSEISAAAKASILIPSPHVAENHQLKNAQYLSQRGAALLIEEQDLTSESLLFHLSSILDNPKKQESLSQKIAHCIPREGAKNVLGEISHWLKTT